MNKNLLILIVVCLGLHHLLMEALYLMPINPLTKYYHSYVISYIRPLFEQRWQLFAPKPALHSLKFWYRCGDEGGQQTRWLDPVDRYLKVHQRWRIGPAGKLIYIYQGIARGFLNDTVKMKEKFCPNEKGFPEDCNKKIMAALKENGYYSSATNLALHECQKHTQSGKLENIDWVQFQTVKIFPKQFSKRKEKGEFERIEYLPSPKIEINDDKENNQTSS